MRILSQTNDIKGYHGLAETVHNLTIEKDALFDKVEELKVEVERLKAEIVIRDKIIDERGKEVFRHDNAIRSLHKQLDNLKSEAIKEFAEKVKKESVTRLHYGTNLELEETECVEVEDIENFLEEMVGEDNVH